MRMQASLKEIQHSKKKSIEFPSETLILAVRKTPVEVPAVAVVKNVEKKHHHRIPRFRNKKEMQRRNQSSFLLKPLFLLYGKLLGEFPLAVVENVEEKTFTESPLQFDIWEKRKWDHSSRKYSRSSCSCSTTTNTLASCGDSKSFSGNDLCCSKGFD